MCCPLLASFPRAIEHWLHRRAMVLVVTASELSLVKAGKRKVEEWGGEEGWREEKEMEEEVLRINSTFYFPLPLQESSKPLISCPLPSILGLPGNGCHVPVLITPPRNHLATHLDDR